MNEIGVAYVRLRSDSTGYQSEVERGVKAGFSNVRNIIGGAFAAAGVFEGAKHIIEAAAEHQSAFAVVDQTLKNAHQSTKLYGQSVEALLEKEARLKGFSDESLASSFIRLVSATKSSATAFTDLGHAEDVARARHVDVTVAALALARAEQGSVQSLSRLGIVIHGVNKNVDELKRGHDAAVASGAKFSAQEKFTYEQALAVAAGLDKQANRTAALATVQDRFGGSAAKFAQTASGQFQRTEQDIHQFEVSVGEHALPVVNSLAEGIGKYAVELTHSQSVQGAVAAGLHDIASAGGDVKSVLEAVGPSFLSVADAALKTVGAIGAPALITAAATYKGIGLAVDLARGAEALYQRVLTTGTGVKAAAVTETAALTAAQRSSSAGLATMTAALAANTDALAINARASTLSLAGFNSIRTGSAAAKTEVEALGTAQVVMAAKSEAAATGGLATFARGIGSLGLAAAGGPVGLAIIGVSVLAGGLVYLGTRESDTERATNELRSAFDLLGGSLNKTRELADALAQTRVDLALAKDSKAAADAAVQQAAANERATRGTKEHATAVLALRTARDQDRAAALAVTQAEERRGQASSAQTKNEQAIAQQRRASTAVAIGLADAERSRDQALARSRGGIANQLGAPGQQFIQSQAAGFDAAASIQFIKATGDEAAKLQAKNPGLATSLRLLAQFARDIGTLPTKKEIQFILDPARAKQSLNVIEHDLLTAGQRQKAAATRSGHGLGVALGDGVAAGIIEQQVKVAEAMAAQVFAAISGGKTAAAAHSPSRRAATEIGLPLAEGIVVGINTGAPAVQAALHGAIDQAIQEGGQQVADAINQAKQNLSSIGGSLASDIGQILNQPLQAQQQALSARQNRLTLDQLKRSIILPGGHTLSANDAIAQRQLERLAAGHGTNQAALQGVLGQFTQDRLAVQQDQVTARANAATTGIANITDLFNRGAINAQQANRRIARLLAADHITYKVAGRELGVAFSDGFQGQLIGLRDQMKALVGSPRLPGAGLVPSIVRPIDTLRTVTQNIAEQQAQRDSYQLAESKKQTKLMQAAEAKQKASDFIKGLPKSERSAVIAALSGTK